MEKCSILFMLNENVLKSFALGLIGHIREMEDMPDNVFFIADSLRKVIMGPFVVTQPQKYFEQPVEFYRGVPDPKKEPCHWLTKFRPHPQANGATKGILWNALADQMGISRGVWLYIRQARLAPEQLDFIFNQLVQANNDVVIDGTVLVEDLKQDNKEWGNFVEELDGGQYQDDEDAYYSTYEGMVDLLFNGDHDLAEANMSED